MEFGPKTSVEIFSSTLGFLEHCFNSLGNEEPTLEHLKPSDPDSFFDIQDTVDWIKQNSYKRVALQFPDSFLPYAGHVSKRISDLVDGVKTFILADTSYKSCCVDFVAAAHANCDCLIHYGESCLTSVCTDIPSKFVLGKLPINIYQCCDEISRKLHDITSPVIIISDVAYDYALDQIVERLVLYFPNLQFHTLRVALNNPQCSDKNLVLGRSVSSEIKNLEDAALIFVGSSKSPLTPIWLMSFPNISTVISYDPLFPENTKSEQSFTTRQLRKRLFLVEKLKDANTVGLVVGTVNLAGHKDAVKRMRTLCKESGKKIYVISVGKVNVPKLSNFSDIDAFVIVSCAFGIILDTTDFYKPVLSLFEAEVALNSTNEWAAGNGWTADFTNFLHDSIGHSTDTSDLSLLTGKIRTNPREQNENDKGNAGQLAVYTAGDYFKQRSWRGLDDSINVNEDTSASQGKAGIACVYKSEPIE